MKPSRWSRRQLQASSSMQDYADRGFAFPIDAIPERDAIELYTRHQSAIVDAMETPARVNPHLLFPWVDSLVRAPPLLDAVAAALGTDDLLLWESAWFYKDGGSDAFVSYHQDST